MRPYLDIIRLVWPLALGMVNNAVMQFVDRAYLAHYSMAALEAVLPGGVLAWMFIGFFQSVVGYSGVFVSQYYGAGDHAKCRSCYMAAVILAVVSGIAMLPMWPIGDRIIAWTASSPEVMSLERTYYGISLLGGMFVCGQMAASSFFTGRGLTRIVFWVNLAGNLLNVILDPILIFGWCGLPEMGIAGAAIATVFSSGMQWLALSVAAHWSGRAESRVSMDLIRRILRFGMPAGLYEVMNMASFAVFVFVTGCVGDVELAASNACFSVNYLVFAPMLGFSLGAQTLVGQARGRGDNDAAHKAFVRTLVLTLSFVAIVGGLTLLFHRPILSIFAPTDAVQSAEFHRLGFVLFLLMSAWMLFDAADVVVSGALKGAGDTRFVMILMLICSFAVWLPVVFVVRCYHNTMPALWSTMILDVLLLCACSMLRWHHGAWKKVKLV